MSAPVPSFSPERWQTVRRLLREAEAQPADARAAWLDAATDDDALRAEVDALLAAAEAAATDGFLDTPAADEAAALFEDAADAYVGRRAGPWRLEERLGEGGMGVVYRAAREGADFQQTAALKLVGRGLAPTALVERFRQERRILARLDHPHIARLLDGGLTEDGQPYFAMELVRGEPVTIYADRRGLDVSARLRLFLDVCAAVAYAHRSLVIHRDLKPSNVVIAEDDAGRPVVKLLDFGIAKLLGEDEEAALLTRTGPLMTPEYAAPEQVRGEAVTTATDVYSLGVLLYELLAGQRPYAIERGAPPTAVEQIVCETEPPPPSAVADSARARRLRGDLDTVVMKALAKEPARRYASADALADDLRRHLDGLPVTARRATAGYRVRAFVRRHPVGVGLSSVAVLALVLGMAGTVWQARVAAAERDHARIEARKAQEVAAFLGDLFDVSNPLSPQAVRGDTLTARTILARGAERVERDLAGEPAVQAELMERLGLVYTNLSQFDEAEALLDASLARRRAAFGPASAETATSLLALGRHWHERGEYERAEGLLRESLRLRLAALGPDHADTAASQHYLALTLTQQEEDPAEAEALFRDALATRRAHLGDRTLEVAYTLNSLGNLYTDRERFDEAEAAHREVLAIRRDLLGADHPSTAISLNNLAVTLRRQERHAEAEPLYREALGYLRQHLGERHTYVAFGLHNLGDSIMRHGRPAEAEPLFREAIAMMHDLELGGHPALALFESQRGGALAALGRHAEAEPLLVRAHDALVAGFGAEHSFVADSRGRLASLYEATGRPEEAARWRG